MDFKQYQTSWEKDNQSFNQYWRYAMFIDYLQVSESYSITKQHEQSPKVALNELPADYEKLLEVYNDFCLVDIYNKSKWWENTGKSLFGISTKPTVRSVGTLSSSETNLMVNWQNTDELVLAIPLTLTQHEALHNIRKLLNKNLSLSSSKKVTQSKYQLTGSRISKKRLINGLFALRFFNQDMPLWKIGNRLALIPSHCFDETSSSNRSSLSHRKYLLSVAASGLIKKAGYIAENAARGIFPCDKRHEHSIMKKRKAGRRKSNK